jgi:RNA polymerase sigma-70 factor (ECF subfamily)
LAKAGLQRSVGHPRKATQRTGTIPIDLETVTEARLVTQALAGSQSAFEQIVRRYQRPVISLIARMTGDRELAEELAQDTFVKAYRNLAAFDTTRRLSSWLFRIAHNTALDSLRRSRPRIVSLDATAEDGVETADVPPAPAQADPVERRALGQAIDAALRTLRPEYRAAITLRYDENLSFAEIGHVLGVPETTARSHVHRARKELAQQLEAAGWAPASGSSATPDSGPS